MNIIQTDKNCCRVKITIKSFGDLSRRYPELCNALNMGDSNNVSNIGNINHVVYECEHGHKWTSITKIYKNMDDNYTRDHICLDCKPREDMVKYIKDAAASKNINILLISENLNEGTICYMKSSNDNTVPIEYDTVRRFLFNTDMNDKSFITALKKFKPLDISHITKINKMSSNDPDDRSNSTYDKDFTFPVWSYLCINNHYFQALEMLLSTHAWCPFCQTREEVLETILLNMNCQIKHINPADDKITFICSNGHNPVLSMDDILLKYQWCSVCLCEAKRPKPRPSLQDSIKVTNRKMSKGEISLLNNIQDKGYQTVKLEYTFKDLHGINLFRFDFYIEQLNCLFEFDGAQHFDEVSKFGGKKGYEKTAEHDKIKEEYAYNNNKRLVRMNNLKTIEVDFNRALSDLVTKSPDANSVMMIKTDEKIAKYESLGAIIMSNKFYIKVRLLDIKGPMTF